MGRLMSNEDGVQTIYHKDDDKVVIERRTDISGLLEANKRQYNDVQRTSRMGDFVHVGRIDTVVLDKWCREDGINYLAPEHKGKLLKKLEERDNRLFKTHPGKFA